MDWGEKHAYTARECWNVAKCRSFQDILGPLLGFTIIRVIIYEGLDRVPRFMEIPVCCYVYRSPRTEFGGRGVLRSLGGCNDNEKYKGIRDPVAFLGLFCFSMSCLRTSSYKAEL